MKNYLKPSVTNLDLDFFVSTQGTGVPLDCNASVPTCDVGSPFGAAPCCTSAFLQFLVPGVNCADINNGADCTITAQFTACVNTSIDTVIQCAEGCVIGLSCNHGNDTCVDGEQYTATCPGFTSCSDSAVNNC